MRRIYGPSRQRGRQLQRKSTWGRRARWWKRARPTDDAGLAEFGLVFPGRRANTLRPSTGLSFLAETMRISSWILEQPWAFFDQLRVATDGAQFAAIAPRGSKRGLGPWATPLHIAELQFIVHFLPGTLLSPSPTRKHPSSSHQAPSVVRKGQNPRLSARAAREVRQRFVGPSGSTLPCHIRFS